jgi:serine phosphatase RsbU (regulator of sigma subunit)
VCVPARTVGGDFYDWYPTADGLAFTLGDVMGKGVGAGMIAAAVRSVIRSSVDDPDPAVALRRAAAGLANGGADDADVHFTTCFHARLHGDGSVDWADAGHGLSLVRRADGSVERLAAGNLPIGIGSAWTSDRAVLAPGDLLVSVSDGVLDLFGGDLDALAAFERLTAGHADAEALVAAIGDLASDGDHADDVTVVAVAYTGVDGPVPASPLLSGTALA